MGLSLTSFGGDLLSTPSNRIGHSGRSAPYQVDSRPQPVSDMTATLDRGCFVMPKLIDETGNQYSRLMVVRRAKNARWGGVRWLCRCECGNETIVSGKCLRSGHTRSCGCLQREIAAAKCRATALPKGEASLNSTINGMRQGARRRGYAWNLTREQVYLLTQRNCFYCGAKPNQIKRRPKCNGEYVYSGLDRMDNDRGYIIDNVVPCCGDCNRAKRIMTIGEFQAWICRVYAHFGKHAEDLQCA